MKKTTKPFVGDHGKRGEQEAIQEQSTSAKISQTKAQKQNDAVKLDAAPFGEDMTHDFAPVPLDGVQIVTGRHTEKDTKQFAQPEAVARLAEYADKNDCAFQIVEHEDGVHFASTLSSFECALTAAILQEFVTQSRSFADQFAALNDAVRERRKTSKKTTALAVPEELPFVQIGQNGDELPRSVVSALFQKYKVIPRELYLDEVFRIYTEVQPEDKDASVTQFRREDGVVFYIYEINGEQTKFVCSNTKDQKDRVTIYRHKAQNFVFVNWTDLARKYLKQDLAGRSFANFAAAVDGLGKKKVLFMDRNGRPSAAQFFTTFHDAAQYGGKYYTLLRLDAPVFDNLQHGRNYLKLSENVEDYLCTRDGVTIRLLFALAVWRNRKKKVEKTTGKELFEQFGTVDDVKNRRFATFWPKLRTALLLLMTTQEVLACKVDGAALTGQTQATAKSKVELHLNAKLCRRALTT